MGCIDWCAVGLDGLKCTSLLWTRQHFLQNLAWPSVPQWIGQVAAAGLAGHHWPWDWDYWDDVMNFKLLLTFICRAVATFHYFHAHDCSSAICPTIALPV